MATQKGQCVCQQRESVRLKGRKDGQEEEAGGAFLVERVKKLTVAGFHDTCLVVAPPGDATYRGHLGPLRVARRALRQPRHIGGRRVVICDEWGGRDEGGGGCGGAFTHFWLQFLTRR